MTVDTVAGTPAVEFIPLGGIGEFGMNMHLLVCGDTALLIDAGVMFPEPELFGVDLVLPDLSALEAWRGKIRALVLTHGHEDHIGGVPHVWPLFDGPVYGTEFTLALVKPKLDEHGIDIADRLVAVKPRDIIDIGSLRVEFLRVPHSIPDCVALAIHTPQGVIIHTGDFKIDQTPLDGETFDYHRMAELGSQGVLALFSDKRSAFLPEVPTVKELGLPPLQSDPQGIFTPKGVPPEVLSALENACRTASESPAFRSFSEKLYQSVDFLPGSDLLRRHAADSTAKEALIRRLNLRAD